MKNNTKIRTFEDLKVWKSARKIQTQVAKYVKKFPGYERYRLSDQMIRSSRSVARNIAEGYGRYHYQENIQFCRTSRGSLTELLNDLITAHEENYIGKKHLESFRKQINTWYRLLNGYIAYLKKAKKNSRVNDHETIYSSS